MSTKGTWQAICSMLFALDSARAMQESGLGDFSPVNLSQVQAELDWLNYYASKQNTLFIRRFTNRIGKNFLPSLLEFIKSFDLKVDFKAIALIDVVWWNFATFGRTPRKMLKRFEILTCNFKSEFQTPVFQTPTKADQWNAKWAYRSGIYRSLTISTTVVPVRTHEQFRHFYAI